jgi:hypothetical protein
MDGAKYPLQAYSIEHFCCAHGLGRSTLYKLIKEGRGPRLMKVGKRTLISAEAAAEWRKRFEGDDHVAGAAGKAADDA